MPVTYTSPERDKTLPRNTPVLSLAATAIMLACGLTIVVTGQAGDKGGLLLIGVIVANLPSAIGAIYSERTDRAVHNGTLPEQARKGVAKAVADGTLQQGVTEALEGHQVVTRDGPLAQQAVAHTQAVAAQTAALVKLLERISSDSSPTTPTPRKRTPRKRATERK